MEDQSQGCCHRRSHSVVVGMMEGYFSYSPYRYTPFENSMYKVIRNINGKMMAKSSFEESGTQNVEGERGRIRIKVAKSRSLCYTIFQNIHLQNIIYQKEESECLQKQRQIVVKELRLS